MTNGEHDRIEERFSLVEDVLRSLTDVVFATDLEGNAVYWNDRATEVTGYSDEELASLNVAECCPRGDEDRIRDWLADVVAEGSAYVEAELLTKEGERIPYAFSAATLTDGDGETIGVCGVGRDVGDREKLERALEALHRTTREVLAADTDEDVACIVADATEHVLEDAISVVYLVEDGHLVPAGVREGTSPFDEEFPTYSLDEDAPAPRVYRTGESETYEDISAIDDDRDRPPVASVLYLPVGERGVLCIGTPTDGSFAATERRIAEILGANASAALDRLERERAFEHREHALATLHETNRRFIDATTAEGVASVLTDAAREVLELPAVATYLWDETEGVLRPSAVSDATRDLVGDPPAFAGDDSLAWNAFVEAETRVFDDVTAHEGVYDSETPIRAELMVPIGTHGILLSGSTARARFDEEDVEFAELLVANARAALDRIEHGAELRAHEERLREQNERLVRLDRINGVIRDINRALVKASSRDEIEEAVCGKLTEVDRYQFAWIGRLSVDADDVTPSAWAGERDGFLDANRDTSGGARLPLASRVLETGEPEVVENVLHDAEGEPWQKVALQHGYHSIACFPLAFKDITYGVLEICADQPDALLSDEVEVVAELTDHIANAINAVERKTALAAGGSVELEFEFGDVDDPLVRLARQTGGQLELRGLTSSPDDGWLVYAVVEDVDLERVRDVVESSVEFASIERVRDDQPLVGLAVSEPGMIEDLAERGATVRTFRAGPEGGRTVVELPSGLNVRAFVEAYTSKYGDVALLRRQPTTRGTAGGSGLYDLREEMTEKQFESLQAAYNNGFFEWPRESTGEEVAEQLGVSAPTFHNHVRRALQQLLTDLFDGDSE